LRKGTSGVPEVNVIQAWSFAEQNSGSKSIMGPSLKPQSGFTIRLFMGPSLKPQSGFTIRLFMGPSLKLQSGFTIRLSTRICDQSLARQRGGRKRPHLDPTWHMSHRVWIDLF
jgi:hypothetical protein